jgi:hypothetical protein
MLLIIAFWGFSTLGIISSLLHQVVNPTNPTQLKRLRSLELG